MARREIEETLPVPGYAGEIHYIPPISRIHTDEEMSDMIDQVRADHAAGASDGPGHWDDSRVAKTTVHEAQPGVVRAHFEKRMNPAAVKTVVHEVQPGSYLRDIDVGTKRKTVPPPKPGPGIPSGGRRLRRHLVD